MKDLFCIVLLLLTTVTAYADKNSKPNKVQQVQPAVEQPVKDTATHYDYGMRTYDPRMGRSMYFAPIAGRRILKKTMLGVVSDYVRRAANL